MLICRYYFFYMAVFVFPPSPPHRLIADIHSASYTLGHRSQEGLKSSIPPRSPHIVVVLAPLRIMTIIILLLLLPVSIVPIAIAAILAVAIVALAPTLLVVVRLLVFIDVFVL